MSDHTPAQHPLHVLAMIFAIGLALATAVMIVRSSRGVSDSEAKSSIQSRIAEEPPPLGVRAVVTAGGVTAHFMLPAMAFALLPGQSLDARLPAGAFEGQFTVTFQAGAARQARLGAMVQGGSFILKRDDKVLLVDAAGEECRTALTTEFISLGRRAQQMTYIFKTDGKQPARLRAMWQPVESDVPLPLSGDGAPLLDGDVMKGLALAQQFNCVACHASADPQLAQLLKANAAPILGDVGARLRPSWLRRWLADPQAVKPDAAVPRLFHSAPTARLGAVEGVGGGAQVEDLTHFLVSLGGPLDAAETPPDKDLAATGMVHYHTVGCFACHGALEALDALPGGRPSIGMPVDAPAPLGDMAMKTTAAALADVLRMPERIWPSGRMPSMNLTELEARSIAAYLISRRASDAPHPNPESFAIDPQRVERGRQHFATLGCANCHGLGPDRSAVEAAVSGPPLESLANTAGTTGCLSSTANDKSPHFALSAMQRQALLAFLRSLPARRNSDVPREQLAVTMARLNCTACHRFHSDHGPEATLTQYFNTVAEADLGDEGRVPPNLSDVGAKLNPLWMREVLEAGGRARPYMGTRMPQFGKLNVEHLPEWFAAAAGVASEPDHGPTIPTEHAAIGRELVGSKGLNCIQCHTIAGHDATGTPGPDLAKMAERLRFDTFARWLRDPAQVRPGTRMPSFFINGHSGFAQFLQGEAQPQIQAVWAYLSQGEFLPLPEGLIDPAGLALQVQNEPMVFRTFMKQAGERAIACGYPEQVHCAFDAAKCRLAVIWQGDFLNAAGAWAARGGSETNPEHVLWTARETPLLRIESGAAGAEPQSYRFRGYRLDQSRRPIFRYQITAGGLTVDVAEQPIPHRNGTQASLTRHFELQGPPGLAVIVDPQGQRLIGDNAALSASSDAESRLLLDDHGKVTFDLEVTW